MICSLCNGKGHGASDCSGSTKLTPMRVQEVLFVAVKLSKFKNVCYCTAVSACYDATVYILSHTCHTIPYEELLCMYVCMYVFLTLPCVRIIRYTTQSMYFISAFIMYLIWNAHLISQHENLLLASKHNKPFAFTMPSTAHHAKPCIRADKLRAVLYEPCATPPTAFLHHPHLPDRSL